MRQHRLPAPPDPAPGLRARRQAAAPRRPRLSRVDSHAPISQCRGLHRQCATTQTLCLLHTRRRPLCPDPIPAGGCAGIRSRDPGPAQGMARPASAPGGPADTHDLRPTKPESGQCSGRGGLRGLAPTGVSRGGLARRPHHLGGDQPASSLILRARSSETALAGSRPS